MSGTATTADRQGEHPDAAASDPSADPEAPPIAARLFWPTTAAALLPIVVAVVRAIRRDWLPIGDNALFLIRGRDVFTEHHPLLGTWTSASLNSGTNFNHPGPLIFDVLAIPTKLWGASGLAAGTALLNGLALVGVGVMARRRGGPVVGLAALLVASLLAWTMGSELLYDPWNPHVVLLPFLFLLTCVWSLAAGDHRALPWAVAASSLIVQTHLSYIVLGTAVGLWGVVGLGLVLRRQRADDPDGWPERRRAVTRTAAVGALVFTLCWIQPVIESITVDGQGNIERVVRNGAGAEETVGVGLGTRIVADTLAVPPFWFRPSFEEALLHDLGVEELPSVDPSFPVAALLLLALAVLMAAVARDGHRRRDREVTTGIVTAGVVLAVGLITSWRLPLGGFYVAAHQFRWLWPAAAFTTLVLLTAALRRIAPSGPRARVGAIALAALTAVVVVANLPTHNVRSGPVADAWAVPTLHAAMAQMDVLEGQGTLLVDLSGLRFAEPYTVTTMAELQTRGIPFTVEDERTVRQLGDRRREVGNASHRLQFREGDAARAGIPGARRVIYVAGLTEAEQDELGRLRTAVTDHLTTSGVTTRDLSNAALAPSHIEAIPTDRHPTEDAVTNFIDRGTLARLVNADLLVTTPSWHDRITRFVDLQHRWQRGSVGLFLSPVDHADGG